MNNDIELVYNEIFLNGKNDEFTEIEVCIPITNRKVIVKIPNTVEQGDRIRLKGLGKSKPDGTFGDAYISFNSVKKVEKENIAEIIKGKEKDCMIKYEYKVLEFVSDFEIEDELNEYGEEGWHLVQIVRKDGQFNLILEREKTEN